MLYARALVVAWVAILFFISAASPQQGRTVIGDGIASCGSWTEQRKLKSTKASFMQAWVLGYATAENFSSSEQSDFLEHASIDAPGLYGWVDNFCRDNPLSTVVQASQRLVIFLRLKRLQ